MTQCASQLNHFLSIKALTVIKTLALTHIVVQHSLYGETVRQIRSLPQELCHMLPSICLARPSCGLVTGGGGGEQELIKL